MLTTFHKGSKYRGDFWKHEQAMLEHNDKWPRRAIDVYKLVLRTKEITLAKQEMDMTILGGENFICHELYFEQFR